MKRILYTALAAVLLLTAVVSGQLGYESMKSGEYLGEANNSATPVNAEQLKVQLAITEDAEMILYPLAAGNTQRNTNAYSDYILKATNMGTANEYIRFYVAVPKDLDTGALHMDVNTADYKKETAGTTTIKGMEYNVYALTYNKSLPAKSEQDVENPQTPAAVYGFYLDETVTLKGSKIYYNKDYTGFENDKVEVYSVVHACSELDTISVPTFYEMIGDKKVPVNDTGNSNN